MLPTRLNSADVKGWARNKMRATGKNAVKAKGSKLSQRLAATNGPPDPPPFGKNADDEDDDDKDAKGKKDPKDPKAAKGGKAPPFGKSKAPPFGKGKQDDSDDEDDDDPDDDDDQDTDDSDDDEDQDADPKAAKGKTPPPGKGKPKGKTAPKDKGKDTDDADAEDDDDEDEDPDAGKPTPGKAKAPADDPNATQQKAPGAGRAGAQGGKPFPPKQAAGAVPGVDQLPNTEPSDPMNAGGPGIPEELLNDMGGDDDDVEDLPDADPILAEVEEKLGDFAETLEDRADEIEGLANEVGGDLSDPDLDTKREVQQLIPDDLRQDLVEHLSGMSDEEIEAFCQHLVEINKIDDPELVAGFLKAAASNSTDDEDGDDEEDDAQAKKGDDGGESDTESDEDE